MTGPVAILIGVFGLTVGIQTTKTVMAGKPLVGLPPAAK
eukprot:CAMPEP_0181288132 /NCGR_PEP_ID=MMETSP1101-20121128/165_1 /TAXON_ID=46948 /ORGANISM="Rhodomonas abbreviata, Strain Caron Lab Isolate" /LENGTH=38 /DNA_ID= /DNA_START= /DNA_END= /DNA_ORIENTATION=